MPGTSPIEVFFSYAHEDEALRDELAKQLKLLQRQGTISTWYDRGIGAGQEWAGQIDEHLESAGIILLLVSPDFLASDYCWDVETKRAMERHEARQARVIPVILRPCDWTSAPFGQLQALPKDAKPITSWTNRDEAFLDVARSIRSVAQSLAARPPQSGAGTPSAGGSASTGSGAAGGRPGAANVAGGSLPTGTAQAGSTAPAAGPADSVRLYEVLDGRFSLEELQALCFELGLDWDDLAGGTRGAKARELIGFLRRRERLDALVDAIRRARPDVAI